MRVEWNSSLHSHQLDSDAVSTHAGDDSAHSPDFDQVTTTRGHGKFLPDAGERIVLFQGHDCPRKRKNPSEQLGVNLGAVAHPGPAEETGELKLRPSPHFVRRTTGCLCVLGSTEVRFPHFGWLSVRKNLRRPTFCAPGHATATSLSLLGLLLTNRRRVRPYRLARLWCRPRSWQPLVPRSPSFNACLARRRWRTRSSRKLRSTLREKKWIARSPLAERGRPVKAVCQALGLARSNIHRSQARSEFQGRA